MKLRHVLWTFLLMFSVVAWETAQEKKEAVLASGNHESGVKVEVLSVKRESPDALYIPGGFVNPDLLRHSERARTSPRGSTCWFRTRAPPA